MMGRISRQPAEVQVAFIRLCCVYWNAECEMSSDHAELEAETKRQTQRKADRVMADEIRDHRPRGHLRQPDADESEHAGMPGSALRA